MREYPYQIRSERITVRVVETREDLAQFEEWITRAMARGPIGVDSETTGLNTYGGDTLRTVQFGDTREGWVLPVEKSPALRELARKYLGVIPRMVLHNATFDLQFFEHHLGIPMSDMWRRVWDTRILAHLVDPRGQEEGGSGHSLEQLVKVYISPTVAEEIKGLMRKLCLELKLTKARIWSEIDIDHPQFNLYAGMDPVLAVRLHAELEPRVPRVSRHLIEYEHLLAEICANMARTGFLLDLEYTRDLSHRLKLEEDEASFHASSFFEVESVNSTEQVADALEELGVKIVGRTPTGKRKVDSALLETLMMDDPPIGSAAHLAAAVHEAKRARKWRTTWVDGFLSGVDSEGRVHPSINQLRARTARMSITGIPAQTLPSGDWMVRRCFIADPGESIVSVDYKAQELRVLAALSGDPTMRQAFLTGADLHQITADASGVPRKVGKMANFLTVYGGQAKALSAQAGIDIPTAKRVLATFGKTYPGVARYAEKKAKEARDNGHIVTSTGRVLPVDRGREYAALNYDVQSTSRDVTCRGLVQLHEAGYTPYLRLPVHDEVVASVPTRHAEWGAAEIARLMRMDFRGVDIDTDPEVYGPSWGHGYMKAA